MRISVLIILLGLSFALKAQRLEQLLSSEVFENATVAVSVADVQSRKLLYNYNGEVNMTPASVQKLVTTATALELLGADFTFKTSLAINGFVEDGILNGDLIVVGGGDPTLGSIYFNNKDEQRAFLSSWTSALMQAGILQIEGDLIIDASLFEDTDVPNTWIWEDLGNYYGAAAKAISVYDNTFEIEFATGEEDGDSTDIIGLSPNIYDVVLKNEVLSSSDQRDLAYVFGDPNTNYRTIRGTLPKNRNSFSIKASIPNPAFELANDFAEVMNDSSLLFAGRIRYSTKEAFHDVDSVIYTWESPELTEIVQQTNFESINLFAEVLGKYMGVYKLSDGSTKAGTKVVDSYWDSIGIAVNNWYLADACGLSRVNSISTNTLTELLVYMASTSKNSKAFQQSIPTLGQEGTQKYYFKKSFLNGKATAKSGSMNRVRSFAGYMKTKKGNEVAFSIIANDFKGGSIHMAHELEKVVEAIYREL